MENLCGYADRPLAFFFRYIRRRPMAHAGILLAVLAAAGCAVSTQYGVKFLVDTLSQGRGAGSRIWLAVGFVMLLIAGDSLFWRVAGWIASRTFANVTGDLRADLFHHLTGHGPSYFADRLPGTLASRLTATSNAMFTMENMLAWNVLPPCVATAGAIAYLLSISLPMTLGMFAVAGLIAFGLFRLAAAGRPLHRAFADKAAVVDGEMVDIIGNMSLVRAFCGTGREYRRFTDAVGSEVTARRRSLLYMEWLRLSHALVTMVLTLGLLAWAITLWRRGAATTGDVVMVCTLGFTILHASRDLAVALVDATQHLARLSEAIAALLVPHDIRDHPDATPLLGRRGQISFENVGFNYPKSRKVFEEFNLDLPAGQRVGLVGESGGGKSTLFALLQRSYDL